MDSNQFGQSRAVYRDVQGRHVNIQRIDRTLGELAQLVSDVSIIFVFRDYID
jgi:syntaxin 1B/2/3